MTLTHSLTHSLDERLNATVDTTVFNVAAPLFANLAGSGDLWLVTLPDRVVVLFNRLSLPTAPTLTWTFAVHLLYDSRLIFSYGGLAPLSEQVPLFAGVRAPLVLNATGKVLDNVDYDTMWRGTYLPRELIQPQTAVEFCVVSGEFKYFVLGLVTRVTDMSLD